MNVKGSHSRILLVDDDQIVLDTLSYGLRQANYIVEPCVDARRALLAYQSSPPDLAILDIGLPDMGGTVLARALLREQYRPILILSSHSEPEWVDRAIGSGVIGYLVKPLSAQQLIPSIETALARFGEINRRIAGKFGGKFMTEEQLVAAMDQFPVGIVIIDQDHHIILSNSQARQLIASERVLLNKYGKLRSTDKAGEFVAMLERSLDPAAGPTAAAMTLPGPGKLNNIELWGTCLPGANDDSQRSAVIVINDSSRATVAPSNLLESLYGFTEKESKLAHALTNGLTISQYCEQTFVTPNTARTHLKSIYRKTSTNRQTDLVRLLSRLFTGTPHN